MHPSLFTEMIPTIYLYLCGMLLFHILHTYKFLVKLFT